MSHRTLGFNFLSVMHFSVELVQLDGIVGKASFDEEGVETVTNEFSVGVISPEVGLSTSIGGDSLDKGYM